MRGVCDSTSPVKANVMLVGLLAAVVVVDEVAVADEVVVIDDVVPEVVEVQPVVMKAMANVN